MTRPTDAASLIVELERRGLTLAVAESLTGGLLAAAFVAVPGASAVFRGGVVAYATGLKHSLLGVDERMLAEHGPVHPDVARQMAAGAREATTVDGRPTDVALATTGVAGPGPDGGIAAGVAYIGIADAHGSSSVRLDLGGGRDHIRQLVVSESLAALKRWLESR